MFVIIRTEGAANGELGWPTGITMDPGNSMMNLSYIIFQN